MKGKLLLILMVGIMTVCLLASCGAPAAGNMAEEEGAEITVEVFDRGNTGGSDPANNYYTDWIKAKVKEDLNITINFTAVPRFPEEEHLNNLMAAQTAPDICFTYSNDLITNYWMQGGIVDLAPYIDDYFPDVKKFLGPDLALPGRDMIMRSEILSTGAVYSIPARRIVVAQNNTFIRKDWLDKLGLDIPKTTEEFVDALRAFKEKDPGNVGLDKVIPFTMAADVRWRASNLLESFVDPNLTDKDRWINTVVDRQFLLPGYKEGVRLLNQMFNEGLIDPEFALYTDDTLSDNLIKSGAVGAFIHSWDQPYRETPGHYRDLKQNVPDAEIISIDPFVNAVGKTTKGMYDAAGLNYFIPIFAKNPTAAMKYINWMAKYENYHFLQVGDEGVTHTLDDEGIPTLVAVTGDKIMNSGQNIDYTFILNGLDLADPVKNAKALSKSYPSVKNTQLIVDAYTNAMKDGRPALVYKTFEPLTAAGPVTQTLIDKSQTFVSQSVMARPSDFDAVWDAGIADWLAAGAQAVIDERAEKFPK